MTTNQFIRHLERLKPDMLLSFLAIAADEKMSFQDVLKIMFIHDRTFRRETPKSWERSNRPGNFKNN
jgi:hypothetical protein